MKNLDLNNYGVQEMNAVEIKETDGGIIWGYVVAYILIEALVNPNAHINAFKEGFNSLKNN